MDTIQRLADALAGRFEVERPIGAGGMAVVYLARDVKHQRQVAVKVLRPDLAAIVGSERFEREIRIVAQLRHPHILPLYDSGTADGLPYFVMPFVEGESLRERLARERQLALPDAVQIACEIADALACAHARGVVHRDIKPGNIMLDSGHAIVTDFGIAFISEAVAAERLTESGMSPGTPHYMSPEQASGEEQIDGRSDIYSLGCVLYEMLAGDPPFTGSSRRAIIARKLLDPVPSLRVVRETVAEELEQVTLQALARVPADRFQTASRFAEALTAVRERMSVTGEGIPLSGAPGRRAISVFKVAGAAAGYVVLGGATLTGIGLLTTTAFDIKLQIPSQFAPSRTDFLLVGGRALLPLVVFSFVVCVAYVAARHALRLGGLTLRSAPRLRTGMTRLWERYYGRWEGLWQATPPSAVAEGFFLCAVVISLLVLGNFWRLLEALWTTESEILACAHRPFHRSYWLSLTVLITAVTFTRHRVFRWLKTRPHGGQGVAVGRWGSLVWIFMLVVIMALPWRLLWEESHERILVGGQRTYVLVETDTDVVVYNPERRATERYDKTNAPRIERGYPAGYVFEEREAFYSGQRGCESITAAAKVRGSE